MASIFVKISNKAGDTRKSSTWYRNAVSSLGDKVTARKLYNQGKIREAGKVITGRLEQIAPGGNLIRGAKFAVPPILAYDMYDRFTYPSNPDQRESLFESPAVKRSAILDL